jgi:hypothetical protein
MLQMADKKTTTESKERKTFTKPKVRILLIQTWMMLNFYLTI